MTEEQQSDQVSDMSGIPDPVLPATILEFPEYGIKWPVPLEVAYGIQNQIIVQRQAVMMQTLSEIFARVSELHPRDKNTGSCTYCGKRSGYPCETLMIVMAAQKEASGEPTDNEDRDEEARLEE